MNEKALDTIEDKGSLKWWILLTVIIGTFLGRLDQTIVNLALPKIINDFSISISAAGWIATAYILANAVFVPIWGKLGDTIGRKKVYMLGFGIFIIGSALAGLAWNLSSMIVFRIIQAIASSADYPTAMAILAITFKDRKARAQALGIWSSSFAAAAVFGPLIGGPLIDHFGWRSVFLLNIPVGLIGMAMAFHFVRESRSEVETTHFDWWGAITLGSMLSALVLVLDQGPTWGWTSVWSILCYVSIAVFLTFFIHIEKHSPEPIVDLKFFKIPAFVNTIMNNFVVFMGMMGGLFLIPIFAQTFLGDSATQSGYLFIPMAAALMLAAPLGGALIGRVPARFVIFASTLVAGLGLYLFARLDARSTAIDIIIPLGIMAFGLGFGMAQRTNIIASLVDPSEIGVASSILALARNVAGAFGIALFGTILNKRTEHNIIHISQVSHLATGHVAQMGQFIALIISKAEIDAYNYVFVISAILVTIGAFAILTLKIPHERHDVKVHIE